MKHPRMRWARAQIVQGGEPPLPVDLATHHARGYVLHPVVRWAHSVAVVVAWRVLAPTRGGGVTLVRVVEIKSDRASALESAKRVARDHYHRQRGARSHARAILDGGQE